ncbi:MAG: transposase [Pseudomonadota bacterium]
MPKRYNESAHARYLTFGCFRRKHLFSDPVLADLFLKHLDHWRREQRITLLAYVVMPNHVHLLVHEDTDRDLGKSLSILKRQFGHEALHYLKEKSQASALELTALDHGKIVYRFWQAGGGYDRNVFSDKAIRRAIEYIHNNPVKAGLVGHPEEYAWSSARFWVTGETKPIALDIPEWFRD